MGISHPQTSFQSKFLPLLIIGPWDVLTGLPAGLLIFMGTVLLSTLVGFKSSLTTFAPLIILGFVSLGVGILAGITRLRRGPATALSAALIASGILAYLWFSTNPGDTFDPLVIGAPGIITTILISPFGGWLGAKIRNAL